MILSIQSIIDQQHHDAWIQTYTSKRFNPFNIQPGDICLEDIAHALSMQCRFVGHTKFHYSIAQHSVFVSQLCNPQDALYGLLHDASEAFLGDVASPIKQTEVYKAYKELEKLVQSNIYQSFGLDTVEPISVKEADLIILATEATQLLQKRDDWTLSRTPANIIIPELTPTQAKLCFLARFKEITCQNK